MQHRILRSWLILIVYCAAILIMSSISTPRLGLKVAFSDKILHWGAFVVMAMLSWRAYRTLGRTRSVGICSILTLLTSTAFGALIEVIQMFLAYRQAEMPDVAADVLGAIVGILICLRFAGRYGF